MFASVLVANRGEIALRVLRAARALGLGTVAVYSDADRGAPHVRAADTALRLGPAPAAESYLAIEAVLDAARRAGAEAIHPGYGFLSENAAFARACAEAGLTFVGPPADVIERMGRKDEARRIAVAAGVPVVPAVEDTGDDDARRAGGRRGRLPAHGQGGGGRRRQGDADRARRRTTCAAAIAAARREARGGVRRRHAARRAARRGRAPRRGPGPRRRPRRRRPPARARLLHPAPPPEGPRGGARADDLRRASARRCSARRSRLAREVGYVNAGTVEFMVAGEEAYLLEMNTRLQVEHPVTELVCGLDLVALQLRVAQGEPLPFDAGRRARRRPRDRGPHLRRGPGRRLPPPGRARDVRALVAARPRRRRARVRPGGRHRPTTRCSARSSPTARRARRRGARSSPRSTTRRSSA